MATVTLSNDAYRHAKKYAKEQNLSVDEFVMSLIEKFVTVRKPQDKPLMKSRDELSLVLQEIADMPRIGELDTDDLNGEKARWEYYKDKHAL